MSNSAEPQKSPYPAKLLLAHPANPQADQTILSIDPKVAQAFFYQLMLSGYPLTAEEQQLIRTWYHQKNPTMIPLRLQFAVGDKMIADAAVASLQPVSEQSTGKNWYLPHRLEVPLHEHVRLQSQLLTCDEIAGLLHMGVASLGIEISHGRFVSYLDPCALLFADDQHPLLAFVELSSVEHAIRHDIIHGQTDQILRIKPISAVDRLRLCRAAFLLNNESWAIQQLMELTVAIAAEQIDDNEKLQVLLALAEINFWFWQAEQPTREALEAALEVARTTSDFLQVALIELRCFGESDQVIGMLQKALEVAAIPAEKIHVTAFFCLVFQQSAELVPIKEQLGHLSFAEELQAILTAYQYFGKHPLVEEWCAAIEERIDSSEKMSLVADFWQNLGHISRGEFWRRKRQHQLEESFLQEQKKLRKLQVMLPFSTVDLEEKKLSYFANKVKNQVHLAKLAAQINARRRKIGLPAHDFQKAYRKNEVREQKKYLTQQQGFYARILQLQQRLDVIGWNFPLPPPPWNDAHLSRLEHRLTVQEGYASLQKTFYNLSMQALIDIDPPDFPLTEARCMRYRQRVRLRAQSKLRSFLQKTVLAIMCVCCSPIQWLGKTIGLPIPKRIGQLYHQRARAQHLDAMRRQLIKLSYQQNIIISADDTASR